MKIIHNAKFQTELTIILDYIAFNNYIAAQNFKNELRKNIENLVIFPYKFRQSFYFDSENIRDLIYQGYTIIYEVKSDKNIIEILDIFNQNQPSTKNT